MATQHYPTFEQGIQTDGIEVETLAAPKTLTGSSEKYQYLEATGGGNEVTLQTAPPSGRSFVIRNTSATVNLDVKQGVVTLSTLLPGLQVGVIWDGANWQYL